MDGQSEVGGRGKFHPAGLEHGVHAVAADQRGERRGQRFAKRRGANHDAEQFPCAGLEPGPTEVDPEDVPYAERGFYLWVAFSLPSEGGYEVTDGGSGWPYRARD